jgi:hypothetical protein
MNQKTNSKTNSTPWSYNDMFFLVKYFSEVYINRRSQIKVEDFAGLARLTLKDKNIKSIITKTKNINTTYNNMMIRTTYHSFSKITNLDPYKQIISSYIKNNPLHLIVEE